MQKLVITGGGTGGHLAIAKAMLQECQKRGVEVFYIGSTSGQDIAWFQNEEGFEQKYFLETYGVVNQRGLKVFQSLYAQMKSIYQAYKILKTIKPDALISVGGYSAGPASFAALLHRIPLFIHEQNAIRGRLNRILSPVAKCIFGSFESSEKHFIKTSYPVREEFFANMRLRQEVKCVLFLGGSQGAVAINDFALKIAPILAQRGMKILHQSGEKDLARVQKAYAELGISAEVFGFSADMASLMQQADLCFARAGASSVWEMCANALPCVYIPYPYAAGNHQYHNAMYFVKRGLGMLCEQQDLNESVVEQAFNLPISTISSKLSTEICFGGADEIYTHLKHLLQ
ncbi:undecaprenyldiphospho-muramoylpentapeptide beta-N-acetylglucosaminyltransferase [Helicobacter enhydrae]|uniref:UDP-N-acetylglucosamine--N-acetylmuramyl-(pentapeptide) pyrophosphoryl-undecaprenol N-acetylglucosamine transferase n=1 Tax=Helicobacter enhydrae TaxID=222136 RepID=A0A1B1U5T8_9HELI|nr:undecaprenyldiphospho-muramoylpentapeptide beta-N-acetylglucosaminyltransferase [Helicobacter enhydrae]ANV98118.1 undecaprenyldiphospho-muramoylpentapeptide beta-N-acetylglucosaminyltransferase [Helicobacter enhydrae]